MRKINYILQKDLFFGVKYNKKVFMLKHITEDKVLIWFKRIRPTMTPNSVFTQEKRELAIAKIYKQDKNISYLIIEGDNDAR